MFNDRMVLIEGAGDLATGVAARLWRCGFGVVMTEIDMPLTVRRTVAFSEAVYDGETSVEGVTARRAQSLSAINAALAERIIPIVVAPQAKIVADLAPWAVIDAIMAKKNLGTTRDQAQLVIGLGPGFSAGQTVHAVIETKRGHDLGRVIWQGPATANTGVPGKVDGIGARRVIRAPAAGTFHGLRKIGDPVRAGEEVALVGETPVAATISGILRGLLHDNVKVRELM